MTSRAAFAVLVVAGACAPPRAPAASATSAAAGASMSAPDVTARAERLYRDAIVVDTHNDMPTKVLDEGYDPAVRHPAGFRDKVEGHTDLPRLVESGLTAEFMSAWVDAPYAATPGASFARAMKYVDAIRAFTDRHPDRLRFATTAADVRRAKSEGKIAILIGVEGGHAIEGSLERLRDLHARGVRYLTLTWNNGNAWAGASMGIGGTRTGGLSPFGRDVVREMNRLGMLVDISHVSDSTFFDAVAASSAPVIASHSSARAINGHPRNLSDDQLRAIARNGGVVNVNFFSRFIDPAFLAAFERQEAPQATRFSVLIDHFDHIARVAGVDHVGIGSDFDGVSALPDGMEDVTRLPRIAQALLDRGYSESDVSKILGGNMMRVMAAVLDRAAGTR